MSDEKRYVLGIDGGTTKSTALLVGLDGSVVTETSAPPVLLRPSALAASAAELLDAAMKCLDAAHAAAGSVDTVVAGVVGAEREDDRLQLTDQTLGLAERNKCGLTSILIQDEMRIQIEAAFAGGSGIAVVGRSGAAGAYRTEDGRILRAGSVSPVFGGEGGAWGMSRDALHAVLRMVDGRGEKTSLLQRAMERFAASSLDELSAMLQSPQCDPTLFAADLVDAAAANDRVARGILLRHATEIADIVHVLVMQSRPRRKLPLVFLGNTFSAESFYLKMARDKVIGSLPMLVVQKPKFPAAFGAAILALNAFA